MKKSFLIAAFGLLCLGCLGAQNTGIQVEAQFAGVKVFVNDSFKGETKEDAITGLIYYRVSLAPGQYKVRCEYTNYAPVESTLTITADGGFVKHKVTFVSSQVRSEALGPIQATAQVQVGVIQARSMPSGASGAIKGRIGVDVSKPS